VGTDSKKRNEGERVWGVRRGVRPCDRGKVHLFRQGKLVQVKGVTAVISDNVEGEGKRLAGVENLRAKRA